MRSGKVFGAAAILAVTLIGCSDSAEKEEPIVIGVNNTSNNGSNNATNNQTTTGTNNNTTVPVVVGIDLQADTNRDGVVNFDASDDEGEDTWDASHGAVFLANMDDDDRSCGRSGNDATLANCFDGNDDQLDGEADLDDMAQLVVRSTGDLPAEATASVRLVAGQDYAQFFVNVDGTWTAAQEFTATAAELKAGVSFRLEGRDIVRDSSIWDGKVRLEATLTGAPDATAQTDAVELRVAPLVLRHHLDPARELYSSELAIGGDGAFTRSLKAAVTAAGVPLGHVELNAQDQWTQDYMETGYMAMPTASGLKIIDVYLRSANIEQSFQGNTGLREGGRVVYTKFHGVDTAGLTAYGGQHSMQWDTLNSFGNTETIPPFTLDGKTWPLGRILKGEAGSIRGDQGMIKMLDSQGVQSPLFIDTGWLLVGHVDETVSFLKTDNARGWVMLANDATMAINLFQELQTQGAGRAPVFEGEYWMDDYGRPYNAATTVSEILQDADVMGASADAVIEVADQVDVIKAATGLTDEDIVSVPFTHWHYDGASIAHQPGMVNGIVVNDRQFMAPDPHGPEVDGVDVFKAALQNVLAMNGYEALFVEDWDMYHRLAGEIHCATNVVRDVNTTGTQWWEMIR
jgi:protein-arginine deiminase